MLNSKHREVGKRLFWIYQYRLLAADPTCPDRHEEAKAKLKLLEKELKQLSGKTFNKFSMKEYVDISMKVLLRNGSEEFDLAEHNKRTNTVLKEF